MSFIGYFESAIFHFEEIYKKKGASTSLKKEFKTLLLQFSTSMQYGELGEDVDRIKRIANKLEEIKKTLKMY